MMKPGFVLINEVHSATLDGVAGMFRIYLNPSGGKSSFTVLVAGNADGEILPPLIIFKSKHLHFTWCTGGPDGPYQ